VDGGTLMPAVLASAAPAEAAAQHFKPNKPPALIPHAPAAINPIDQRTAATAIAQAAYRLARLRDAWLVAAHQQLDTAVTAA
jgi:hypothetical protein